MKELKGTKTEQNLWEAFAGPQQVHLLCQQGQERRLCANSQHL